MLGTTAHNWKTITENQRLAWNEAAKLIQSRSRLGQSGPLTGLQLYVRINFNLSLVGEPTVGDPPAAPTFDANVIQSLELTNVTNVVAIKLVCSGSSDAFNLVWAAAPQSPGRFAVPDFNYLGELPEVADRQGRHHGALRQRSSALRPSARRCSSAPSRWSPAMRTCRTSGPASSRPRAEVSSSMMRLAHHFHGRAAPPTGPPAPFACSSLDRSPFSLFPDSV